MKISIIVPVYNTKHEYLRECLNSLMHQLNFSDYEVIAVNDGSTNGCEKVINEFVSDYSGPVKKGDTAELVYINQENGGTSVARNTGLSAARGEYVMFVDADDFISHDCLVTVYDAVKRKGSDILFFGYATSYTNREMRRVLDEPHPGIWERDKLELAVLKGNPELGPVEVGAPWGKIIKRDIIGGNDLKYTKGLIKGQDTVFMLSVFEHADTFSYIPYLGYHYRISGVSVSRRYNPGIVDIMEKTLNAYEGFVQKYEKPEEFAEAVRLKYYKVMLGEYLELLFLHKENKTPEKAKENEFLAITCREPYRSVLRDIDPGNMGSYQRILFGLIKNRNIRLLFLVKRAEMFLRNLVVRKYN